MALVAVVDEEEVLQVPFETQQVLIVLEDMVVMAHRSWTDALVLLFALVYALHLQYPEKLSGFFEFIQVILLDLDDGRRQLSFRCFPAATHLIEMISLLSSSVVA